MQGMVGDTKQQIQASATAAENSGAAYLPREAHSDFLRALLDTNPEALIVIDTSGSILAFSRAARAMFGYSESEVLGRNVNMLMPSPDHEQHDNYIRNFLETGQKRLIGIGRHVMATNKDGHSFPVDLSIGEATIAGMRLFLGFLRDSTEEEEQRRSMHNLRGELAHALRVSSMGLLANAIAHEINQPLASIRNYVETIGELARGDATVDQALLREAMHACSHETERAGEIIRRLRQFMAKGDTEQSQHSLARLVGEGLALALADGEGTNVEVKLHLDKEADAILADGVHIQQVIFNLARNALQAMHGRQNSIIQVSSMKCDAMVEVVVEDSGGGLSETEQQQLFLPFNTSKPDGLGVGLSICRTIVEGHDGQIWSARSELGGAAFHFTLPRILSDMDVRP